MSTDTLVDEAPTVRALHIDQHVRFAIVVKSRGNGVRGLPSYLKHHPPSFWGERGGKWGRVCCFPFDSAFPHTDTAERVKVVKQSVETFVDRKHHVMQ